MRKFLDAHCMLYKAAGAISNCQSITLYHLMVLVLLTQSKAPSEMNYPLALRAHAYPSITFPSP